MYRLLKFRNTHINGLSFQNNRIAKTNVTPLRTQSTDSNDPKLIPVKARKKRAKVVKKVAEIISVTNSSASESTAYVKKLKAKEIKMLALTSFNLNELYKLKDFMRQNKFVKEHTYNNLTDMGNVPIDFMTPLVNEVSPNEVFNVTDLNRAPVEELTEIDDIPELQPIRVINDKAHFLPEVVEVDLEPEPVEKKVVLPRQHHAVDLKVRREIVTRTLISYTDLCGSMQNPERALHDYRVHKHRNRKNSYRYPLISDVRLYNSFLKGFALKGNFQKIQEVLTLVKEENVSLNSQSYAAIFECLGRVTYMSSYTRHLRAFTNEAAAKGITYDMMLNESNFLYDQKQKMLEAMHAYNPKYLPNYRKPDVQYDNELLDALNDDRQLEGCLESRSVKQGILSKDALNKLVKEQMEIEKQCSITIKSIQAFETPSKEALKFREHWNEHLRLWEEIATKAFHRDLAVLTKHYSPINIDQYLQSIPVKDFVSIIIQEAQKLAQGSETYSPTVNMLYRDLGSKVYARYKIIQKQKSGVFDKVYKIHTKYCEQYAESHPELDPLPGRIEPLNPRQMWQWAEHSCRHEGGSFNLDQHEWVPTALQAIGKFLYDIIMLDLQFDVDCISTNAKKKSFHPCFFTVFRYEGRLMKEEVKPHPSLSKLYRLSVPETLNFPVHEVPMKCPPIPWISTETGGYLVAPSEVIRLTPHSVLQKQRLKESKINHLYPSFDALNQLASVPWKVNKDILNVIIEVFKNGGSSRLDVPEPPSSLTIPPKTPGLDKQRQHELFRLRMAYRRRKAEMYSLWCDCLYRLSLANHFKDDVFWLPHNMDFRGRVYPVPPHLNHLGSDLARSMLVFAEARPLGPRGLDWLKIHLINLTGTKKRGTLDERLEYANEILDKILDSADNPLTGRMWWAESDEPWQTLACCMEIAAAHRSPNPEEYKSHFPVHQDGSCNGLQHYAALGRDSAGAYSVNLSGADKPQDVYSAVVTLVEERRARDAINGSMIAQVLSGFIHRKVIKQTIMTTVYGVTRYGARLQIEKQLKDLDGFPKEHIFAASLYLTSSTFESLRSMFVSTREIQDWFTECARHISTICEKNVEWVTPLGLPIVQPYFKHHRLRVTKDIYQSFHMDTYEKPNVLKQKNAFPPNFVHSLDSSHMMLTSLYSERAGITFVSVHDCYWTHPSTVHIMNKICREQFVALHSQQILENLSIFLTDKFSFDIDEMDLSSNDSSKKKLNKLLVKLPRIGNFNIKEVLNSVYFFS